MNSVSDRELRNRLVNHLKGGHAFSTIENVLQRVPFSKVGVVPDGLPYSFYQQFYHIRISQFDILEYCRDENYQAPDWPEDYWPDNPAPADESGWNNLVQKYFDERDEFCDLIMASSSDLFNPFKANPDHNLFREAQLIIEHTAYHTGQLYIIYQLLSAQK